MEPLQSIMGIMGIRSVLTWLGLGVLNSMLGLTYPPNLGKARRD